MGRAVPSARGRSVTRPTSKARRVRPIFPGAARLEACEVIRSASGVPALFLRTLTADSRAGLYRLPEGVGVTFQASTGKGQGVRAVFSSPEVSQVLNLSEGAYAALLEGLARLREARQEVGEACPPEDLPGKGHTLKCAAVIFEEGQRPALYVGTAGPDFAAHVYRVPEGVRVRLEAPDPLPAEVDKKGRAAALKGRALLEGPQGSAALAVSAVSTARALLEVLEAFEKGRAAYHAARAHFEGRPGEETAGQGAA